MKDIKDLTDAEARTLCEAIGAEALRQLYFINPKNFAKICRGFRASTLSADKVIDLTVKNRDQEFVARFLKLNRDAILRKERREEFARLTDLTTDIAKAELKRNAIRDEIAAANKQLTETQSRLAKVKRDAEFYTNRHKDLEPKVSALQNRYDQLTADIERREREIETLHRLNDAIERRENEIAILQNQRNELDEQIEQRKQIADTVQREVTENESNRDKLQQEIDRLHARHNELIAEIERDEQCKQHAFKLPNEMATATQKLAQLKQGVSLYEARCTDLKRECADLQPKRDKLIADIERREREIAVLQTQFDKLTTEIEQLKLQSAAIKSENAQCTDAPSAVAIQPIISSLPTKIYRAGQTLNIKVDPESFIDAFIESLGIDNEKIAKFAEYLRAAYDKHMPLLLAGSRAHDIADAFSIALTGKTAAVLDCSGVDSLDDLNFCEASDDTIIAALNPLAPNFVAYLPELLGIKDKFVIAIFPFADDLKFEPRGLFNYFLPICTELVLPKRINQFEYVSDELRELLEGEA